MATTEELQQQTKTVLKSIWQRKPRSIYTMVADEKQKEGGYNLLNKFRCENNNNKKQAKEKTQGASLHKIKQAAKQT